MQRLFSRLKRQLTAGPLAVCALAIIGFSVLVSTGATASGSEPAVSTSPQDIAAGQNLYIEHCQSCHGVNGVGGHNGSPELVDAGAAAADFFLSTGRMPLNAPSDQPISHKPFFTKQQIRELVAYINDLPEKNDTPGNKGPTIPTVAPLCSASHNAAGCVTLAEGQQNFALNCAQCHQADGAGGMLSKGDVVPSLHQATITQIAEAVRVGPKPMPIFGDKTLSSSQVSSIAQYVKFLQKSQHHGRGGLSISGFGPVAEGFIGIILGLGLLLFVSRMIGNRG